MFNRGQLVELEITDYAFGGRGIVKIPTDDGNFIVFVDNAFPGQRVSAKINTKRKKHAESNLVEVIERSEFETETQFQEISGGPYIRIPLSKQGEFKQKSTLDTFSRLSGIRNIDSLFDTFIESYIKDPEEVKIEGLINDSDIYDFYLKYRNQIDDCLKDIKFYDRTATEVNAFSLYEYVIKGTNVAVKEFVSSLANK